MSTHVKKPIPHGLRLSLSYSEADCAKMGIPEWFAGNEVKNWSSIDQLAVAAAKGASMHRKPKLDAAYAEASNIFQHTAEHHGASCLAMLLYCQAVKKVFSIKKNKQLFCDRYMSEYAELKAEKEVDDLRKDIEHETTKNSHKETLLSTKLYGLELDEDLDQMSKKTKSSGSVSSIDDDRKP